MSADNPNPLSVAAPPPTKPKRAPTLYVIIGMKVLKGLGLLILALGVFMLRYRDLPDLYDRGLKFFRLDPEGKFFEALGERIATITPANVKAIALGISLYGILMMVEGIGLALRARWAIWLVIFQSAFFVPIELDRYLRNGSLVVLGLMVINILVIWYLFQNRKRLFHTKH